LFFRSTLTSKNSSGQWRPNVLKTVTTLYSSQRPPNVSLGQPSFCSSFSDLLLFLGLVTFYCFFRSVSPPIFQVS
jgi:hypothetical protein